jgi:hypothetical protein
MCINFFIYDVTYGFVGLYTVRCVVVLNVYVGAEILYTAGGHHGHSWYVSLTSVVLCKHGHT